MLHASCLSLLLLDSCLESEKQMAIENQRESDFHEILVCAACQNPITTNRERISVNGGHEHRFFNPLGILFLVGCFSEAQGCQAAGPQSREFSWFPGYSWQIVSCSSCECHLGWSFEGPGQPFLL